ncbi:MAG: efflux RND transporter periplasmic adaptor subunit [Bryobacteraceae bacterium]
MQSKSQITLAVILATAGFVIVSCTPEQQAQSVSAPPPVPVTVAKATQESVPFEIRVIGNVEASSTVQVKSQVSGQLMNVGFVEGQNVNKGDLLFQIDSRPYREALRQAEAAVQKDKAQIAQSEAMMARDIAQSKNADAEAARHDELARAGVISKAQYDEVRTSADVFRESVRAAEAAIQSARAALASDMAAVEKAKLDISYCEIHAPISGRTGNLLVNAGNLVQANGDSPLVVIHQVTPIFVSFSVPEQHLPAIRRRSASHKLPVRVSLQNNPEKTIAGQLSVIDNTVDIATGTIRLKATLANKELLLWPGQFVDVVLTLDTIQNATIVPAEAIQASQQGQLVYVVKSDGTVEPRTVTTGRSTGGKTIIEKGVSPNETVVTDGQLRLFPGARTQVVDPKQIEEGTL